MDTSERLTELLSERILILDGAMGTMIQRRSLTEADFRGERFAEHGRELRGNNDLLVLTRPDVITDIHDEYLAAGSDLIETNTFSATSIAQADYALEHAAYDINRAAAEIARLAAAKWTEQNPRKPRFVAGALGPLNRTLSISPKVEDPAFRSVTFFQVRDAYREQVRGLLDGGVDTLLVETIFDTLNAKAALVAIDEEFAERGLRVPVMISVTITDRSGRTLSGQTVEAFWTSVAHARPLSIGANCALGAKEMRPYIAELAELSDAFASCYPNAGLPNAFGGYDEAPEMTASLLREFASAGFVNLVGGCCGTTPDHIRAISAAVSDVAPRKPKPLAPRLSRYSGLEPLVVRPESNFLMIGERTNVTGSAKFASLVRASEFGKALEVALDQVRGGANILDVNMDEGMLDSEQAMGTFLRLIASEPEICRIPIMVDSSKWSVLLAGLECLQGKGIVNSISLKEGEADFVHKAETVKRFGAAVVVMAFDEQGQAETVERKVSICRRAYGILTERVKLPAEDIIFDPNVLAIATGIEEHQDFAKNFIEATRLIKASCPGVKISGGISNLSFSFRGNQVVREAMHAAFLYHAIRAGLDMGIVNAGQLAVYEDIPKDLLEQVEDVIFNRRPDATERLVSFAESVKGGGKKREVSDVWRQGSLKERLAHALVHGVLDYLEADLAEALKVYERPIEIIEGPLMDGMKIVGDRFGEGKMFLPQVVKSARAMKRGVAFLEPYLLADKRAGDADREAGKVLLATVKGDVHDIGKNIVGVVLGCNNYKVIDLGVMVPCEKILDTAVLEGVDMIGLSGLITPSLDEMVHVAKEMARREIRLPLLIGGATTSRQHTAVKIAPEYAEPVVHVLDASRAVGVVSELLDARRKPALNERNRAEQERLRENFRSKQSKPLLGYDVANSRPFAVDWTLESLASPEATGETVLGELPLREISKYIDWTFLFTAFELRGRYPEVLSDPAQGPAARELFAVAEEVLAEILDKGLLRGKAVFGIWPAHSEGNDIVLFDDEEKRTERARFCMLRQQRTKDDASPQLCLADWVAPKSRNLFDHVGAFAVSTGFGLDKLTARYESEQDDYRALVAKALADRLAEAATEWLHERIRRDWGHGESTPLRHEDLIAERYRGIRPAFGYPACPDHTDKRRLFALLRAESLGLRLTESCAMVPTAAVAGIVLAHPEAKYFNVGRIGRDQVVDYAARKGISVAEAEKWLAPNLGYDPA